MEQQSKLISGISNGFSRISMVVGALIILIGCWSALNNEPYFSETYRFTALSSEPIKTAYCPDDYEREYSGGATSGYRSFTTPKGRNVHINFCFEKSPVKDSSGRITKAIVYKQENGYIYWNATYSDDVRNYFKDVIAKFNLPEQDGKAIDDKYLKVYWSKGFEDLGTMMMFLFGWVIFHIIVRFIWRGFVAPSKS